MATEETLPPNFGKLDGALRSIGYSFEVAVADIVDNCIDAKASHILVRLITRDDGLTDLAIWDNGTGMSPATLKEAMRFGSDVAQDIERLGKFGLGLKLASLSQAKELHVISLRDGKLTGRAWLEQGIASGFTSTVYDSAECRRLLDAVASDKSLNPNGTLVYWSRLYRVGRQHKTGSEHAQQLIKRLENHLSLAFHRFLSGTSRSVAISLDIFDQKTAQSGIPIILGALDPFAYGNSGRAGFPLKLLAGVPYRERVNIEAHIWPPNSTLAEYRLPGGSNARQGFYFYRNGRLIQGGGWNGLRESEPHSSLARLAIDIPAEIDVDVSLDVRKVEIQLPHELELAIVQSKAGNGIDFKKYLSVADDTYRKRRVMEAELPLIPSGGLPATLGRVLKEELRHAKTSKHRPLAFRWRKLEPSEFFSIDREGGFVDLNVTFRKSVLQGMSASSADAPLLKCLLFLLLEDALSTERTGPKLRAKLDKANRVLVEAVKYQPATQ